MQAFDLDLKMLTPELEFDATTEGLSYNGTIWLIQDSDGLVGYDSDCSSTQAVRTRFR